MIADSTVEPTDAEILDAAEDFRSQYMHGSTTFDEFDEIGFARAVLAKWGAPTPASSKSAAVLASGPVGFDHKTAVNFPNGKAVTDDEIRLFVAHSRWAHDDRDWLRNTIADLRREIAQRDAEIALLKTSLLDAEAPQPAAQAQEEAPDMFWDADDTENFAHEIQDIIDGYGPGEIVTIECAKRLPNFRVVVTRDGDWVSYEYLEAAHGIAAQKGDAA